MGGSLLPPGFKLDPPPTAGPVALPPGFTLDAPIAETPRETPLNPVVAEAIGAFNRGAAEIPDFAIRAFNQLVGGINELGGFGPGKKVPTAPTTLELAETVLGEPVGQEGFMDPGIARDVVQAGGEFIPAAATLVSGARNVAGKVTERLAQEGSEEAARVAGLQRAGDTRAVTKTISEVGEAVKDPKAIEAIKQGFGEGVIAQLKGASEKTKQQARRMVSRVQRGLTNETLRQNERPADVAGGAVMDRFKRLTGINKKAGNAIDKEAKKLGARGETVDLSTARQKLGAELSELGVRLRDDGTVILKGSQIEDVKGAKGLLNLLVRRLADAGNNALSGHNLKRLIDTKVDFSKKPGVNPLEKKVEDVLKNARRNIDQALDAKFSEYKKQNDIFAETKAVIDEFQSIMGKNTDLSSKRAGKAVGTRLRRLTGNPESRVRLMDSIEELNTVGDKHLVDVSDDIGVLARLADELDTVFKPVADTSFRAEVAKAGATGGKSGVIGKLAETGVEKLRGINDLNKLKAIKGVLRP